MEQRSPGPPTPFQTLVLGRRSIRRFTDQPVDREKILACLEAARLAPSAHNVQPWRFIVVDDPVLKEKLTEAAFSGIYGASKFAARAPVLIVILARPDLIAAGLGSRLQGVHYGQLDIGIAGEHIVLQAEEFGLATCWMGWFNFRRVRKILRIPRKYKIMAMMPVGYAEKRPRRSPPRFALENIAWFNGVGEEGQKLGTAED